MWFLCLTFNSVFNINFCSKQFSNRYIIYIYIFLSSSTIWNKIGSNLFTSLSFVRLFLTFKNCRTRFLLHNSLLCYPFHVKRFFCPLIPRGRSKSPRAVNGFSGICNIIISRSPALEIRGAIMHWRHAR